MGVSCLLANIRNPLSIVFIISLIVIYFLNQKTYPIFGFYVRPCTLSDLFPTELHDGLTQDVRTSEQYKLLKMEYYGWHGGSS